MTDFDALLKRSFAEAHEPADDGFVVNVTQTVAKREASLRTRGYLQLGAITIGAAAVTWGLSSFAGAVGDEFMAVAGLEVARAFSALTNASASAATSDSSLGFAQAVGAGMTQILLVTAALAGGAVAYRAARD